MDGLLRRLAAVSLALVLIGVALNLPAAGALNSVQTLKPRAPVAHRGTWPAWAHNPPVAAAAPADPIPAPHAMQAPSGPQRTASTPGSALGGSVAGATPPAWHVQRASSVEQRPTEAPLSVHLPPPRFA